MSLTKSYSTFMQSILAKPPNWTHSCLMSKKYKAFMYRDYYKKLQILKSYEFIISHFFTSDILMGGTYL